MTAVDHLRAALDELDAEASELQHRLTEIAAMRVAIAPLIDGTGTVGHDAVTRTPTADAPPVKPAPPKASPVQPTERAKPRKAGGGSGRAHDYAEVARVAREAHVAGRNMADAVAAHLGCGHSGGKHAIAKARKAGHDIPTAPTGRPPKTAPRRTVDADSLPAPEDRPRTSWAPKPGEMVLSCADCGHVEPVTGATALNRHCLANHRRTASIDERMPVRWDGAA